MLLFLGSGCSHVTRRTLSLCLSSRNRSVVCSAASRRGSVHAKLTVAFPFINCAHRLFSQGKPFAVYALKRTASATTSRLHQLVMKQAKPTHRKALIFVCWLVYVGVVLCSDLLPGSSVFRIDSETIREALDLSMNFFFILPLLSPSQAPVLHPVLESTFQIVVCWALLFIGFLSDDISRHCRTAQKQVQKQILPMWVFLVGSALLTNVFYLPYLVLRQNPSSLATIVDTDSSEHSLRPFTSTKKTVAARHSEADMLLRIAESRGLPLILCVVALFAMLWGFAGRPEYPAAPPFTLERFQLYWQAFLQKDRLAVSFPIDMLVFALFQAELVPDDMRRRGLNPQSQKGTRMLGVARWIPFFGVAWYLWTRPRLCDSSANAETEQAH